VPLFKQDPDVDPGQLIEDLAANLANVYNDLEVRLQAEIVRRLKRDLQVYPSLTQRLAAIQELDKAAKAAVGQMQSSKEMAEQVIAIATQKGTAAAATYLKRYKNLPRAAQITNTQTLAIDQLTFDLSNRFEAVNQRILRYPQDIYQKTVAAIAPDVLAGAQTLAVTQASIVQNFLSAGITGFVDSAGRNWRIGSYAEMATRTATARAWNDAGIYRMQQVGLNLVTPIIGYGACELCAAWAGTILSTDGSTGTVTMSSLTGGGDVTVTIDATLEQAIAAGLHHPNCRCQDVAYIPGEPAPTDLTTYDPEAEQARTQLRSLEREVRSGKRDAANSMNDTQKRAALNDVADAQAKIREHVAKTGITRRNYREQLHFSDGH
jgi:hypothetical protein